MTAKNTSQKNNDTMLKVIALICAVLLWFYAEAQENPSKERQLTVPIQYVNLASDYVVESANQSVQVTVKGNETDIMSLRSDDFTAVVDLSGASAGSASYPVQVTGTTVTERFTAAPEHVTVSIDKIVQKEVSVRVRTDGTVSQYYELKNTDVQPDAVTIRGKSKVLADITDVETEIIDISGIKNDIEQKVALNLPDGVTAQADNSGFSAEPQIVVAVHVQPVQQSRTLETTIALRNVPDGLTAAIDVERAVLLLEGDAELLETQPILDQLQLHVDCSGLSAGEYILPIQVESSNESVHGALRTVSPQTVTVTLTKDGTTFPVNGNENEPGIEENKNETNISAAE